MLIIVMNHDNKQHNKQHDTCYSQPIAQSAITGGVSHQLDGPLQAQTRAHGAGHRLRASGGRQRPGRRAGRRRAADGDGAAGAGARGDADPSSDAQWQLGKQGVGVSWQFPWGSYHPFEIGILRYHSSILEKWGLANVLLWGF